MTQNKRARVLLFSGAVLMLLGVGLLLSSAGLIYTNSREDEQAGEMAAQAMPEIRERQEAGAKLLATPDYTPDYVLDPEREMPVLTQDGRDYIGELEISKLDLALPVQSEWSYPGLKISPCRYTGSAYQGDLTIAAHNYKTHFGKIKNLEAGDEVKFTDVDGNEFLYTVKLVQEIEPRPTDAVSESGYDLVLFTCTLGGATRVAVFCELSEGTK